MPRRRVYIDRPHGSLLAAAETHRRIVERVPHSSEQADETGTEGEATQTAHHARAQRRGQRGQFA